MTAIDNNNPQRVYLFGQSTPAPRGVSPESREEAAHDFSAFIRQNPPAEATRSQSSVNVSNVPDPDWFLRLLQYQSAFWASDSMN